MPFCIGGGGSFLRGGLGQELLTLGTVFSTCVHMYPMADCVTL